MASNVTGSRRVIIVTPAPRGSQTGNRKTALRWSALLRQLGARVRVLQHYNGEECDLLLAVHAVKSAKSVLDCAKDHPDTRIAILCAGTDLYPVFRPGPTALAALERADALVTLQPRAIDALPPAMRAKARTIVQSATAAAGVERAEVFTACVLAHLRAVKDPLLPFEAMSHVDPGTKIELIAAGRALTPQLADAARAAGERDPRCQWIGEVRRPSARQLLARSHVCIVASTSEGGANVVSEAIAATTPVLATAIPGNLGLLGDDWPGLFETGNSRQLGQLLNRAANDSTYYDRLTARTRALQDLVVPARERAALHQLLADVGLG